VVHVVVIELHVSPGLHSLVTSSHVPPVSEMVLATHVALLPWSMHVALLPHECPSHGWPTPEDGKHVPHVEMPPSPGLPKAHAPLAHCVSAAHGLPVASDPVLVTHVLDGSANSVQPLAWTAFAHEVSDSVVMPWPGSASACAQSFWNRARTRDTSSAGGFRVEHTINASNRAPQGPSVVAELPPLPPPLLAFELLCPECPPHASASVVLAAQAAPMKRRQERMARPFCRGRTGTPSTRGSGRSLARGTARCRARLGPFSHTARALL
jgi:hypothetical protein